jgi:hypothetical protein
MTETRVNHRQHDPTKVEAELRNIGHDKCFLFLGQMAVAGPSAG